MSSKGRPTGVAILAILEAIAGVYYLVTGFGDFVATSIIRTLAGSGIPSDILLLISHSVGAVLLIFGLASLLLAWGLWTGKGWALMIALVIAILSIIASLISFHLIGLVIDGIIIYYLTRPNVKQFFTK